jgi:hypothetical protein
MKGRTGPTIATLQKDGFHNTLRPLEPGLTGIGTEPAFAIAQRAMLLQTEQGNVLWECLSLLDDETVAAVQQLGSVSRCHRIRHWFKRFFGKEEITVVDFVFEYVQRCSSCGCFSCLTQGVKSS